MNHQIQIAKKKNNKPIWKFEKKKKQHRDSQVKRDGVYNRYFDMSVL